MKLEIGNWKLEIGKVYHLLSNVSQNVLKKQEAPPTLPAGR